VSATTAVLLSRSSGARARPGEETDRQADKAGVAMGPGRCDRPCRLVLVPLDGPPFLAATLHRPGELLATALRLDLEECPRIRSVHRTDPPPSFDFISM
jgi:hypothetical protein